MTSRRRRITTQEEAIQEIQKVLQSPDVTIAAIQAVIVRCDRLVPRCRAEVHESEPIPLTAEFLIAFSTAKYVASLMSYCSAVEIDTLRRKAYQLVTGGNDALVYEFYLLDHHYAELSSNALKIMVDACYRDQNVPAGTRRLHLRAYYHEGDRRTRLFYRLHPEDETS